MKILAVANQKGGVGKSTLTVHLAYAAREAGLRVLLVDMDNQGSLSLTFDAAEGSSPGLVASALFSAADQKPEMISEKLSIIRSDIGLLDIVEPENQEVRREVTRRPGQALRHFAPNFDLCLIDTPPSLGMHLMASLTAADYVLTPVSVGLFELAGVGKLMSTIHVVRTQGLNPRLRHIGILPMKTNSRSTVEGEGLAMLRQQYGSAILSEALPERAPVRQAIARKVPVWTNTKGGGHLKAANEWRAACAAILKRLA